MNNRAIGAATVTSLFLLGAGCSGSSGDAAGKGDTTSDAGTMADTGAGGGDPRTGEEAAGDDASTGEETGEGDAGSGTETAGGDAGGGRETGGGDAGTGKETGGSDAGTGKETGGGDAGTGKETDGGQGAMAVGVNDGNGWGPNVSSYFYGQGIHWDRIDNEGQGGASGLADAALAAGWSAVIIVDTNESNALSTMQHYASYGSRVVFEYTNEPWEVPVDPGTYAQNYQTVRAAKVAAGIQQPLLFQTIGSGGYPNSNGTMWIDRGLAAVPGLQVDAFSTHPYGQVAENNDGDSYGVAALIADQAHTASVAGGRFANTPFWVTEFGFTLNPDNNSGYDPSQARAWYVPSYADQASQLTQAYAKFVTLPWLKGVLWYQAHDDSTGWFGLVTSPTPESKDNAGEATGNDSSGAPTPVNPRPSLSALVAVITQLKSEGRLE